MNRHTFTVALSGIALAAFASGCDNGKLTDTNKNPNAPETVSADLLFPTAAIRSVQIARGTIEITPSTFVHWPQYMAEYQYPEISYYQFRPTTADGWWNTWYSGPLEDFAQALKKATEADRPNQVGPILVMRAFDYSIMTGIWGDVPFSQANRGDQGNITPAYDAQKSVYDSLLTNLADASSMMGGSGAGFGGQDPVYAGDAAKWQKLANSLRARLGMNLSNVDAARAKTEVAAAVAAGGFASNSDNAQISWPGDNINDNPWYDNQKEGNGTRDDARFSATFIDTLKHLADPRLQVFARPVQDETCGTVSGCTAVNAGDYRGMPNGLLAGSAGSWGTKSSRLGAQVFAATQPSYIMTFAEFSFIKAEAAERGWISGSAAQFYQDGITASMKQWGVADADITTYLAQSRITYAGGAAGLAQIGVQKWIALFTQGFEAWSEWRRTGFPNLSPAQNAKTSDGQIPRRVIYPQTEQSFNNTNLQAAIGAQGGSDALSKKLWIDK
jgi:Starch-binding associating with outer membrane